MSISENIEKRQVVKILLGQHIETDVERANWIIEPQVSIRKATLTFVAKFFLMLFQNIVSPTRADNILTWDREIMVATRVVGLEFDFTRIILVEIHDRVFRHQPLTPFHV